MATAQARADELPRPGPLRLHGVFWNALGHGSVAYALTQLFDNLPDGSVDRSLWFLGGSPMSPRPYFKPALSQFVYRALCKLRVPAQIQGKIAGAAVLRAVRAGDIVYMWPPYDLRFMKRVQKKGGIVVAERTNVMDPMGREVLSRAYARRGMTMPAGWFPPEGMALNQLEMKQCDFVVARNNFVTQSLLDVGIPRDRILEGAYGFSPSRLAAAIGTQRPSRPPVFAFVGLCIVRKGFDVLLEAWRQAGVDGRLVIAGHIEDDMREAYAEMLARPDVQLLGHVRDIASVYADADVFVFPTHEEGGPQVTYEAAGCGLPSIVSPMGAGRIVRDGVEALIVDPLKVDELAAAIVRLAEDATLRREMGEAASKRAREFTWAKAGEQLYALFSGLRPRAGGLRPRANPNPEPSLSGKG